MSNSKVLIIGAGLGGLTLARSLRTHNIDFEIFERDDAPMARTQGWAVALHQIVPELKAIAPKDAPPLESTSVTRGVCEADGAQMYNSVTKERRGLGLGYFIRANRGKLREWLSTGISIQWGKRLQRYELVDDGVMAHFDDGTTAEGRILVGADGVRSQVRKLLAPINAPKSNVLPIRIIIGELTLNRAQYLRQLALGPSLYLTEAGDEYRFFVGLRYFSDESPPLTASYYWFVFCEDKQIVDGGSWMEKASQADILAWTRHTCRNMHPDFYEILKLQNPDGILPPWRLSTHKPFMSPSGPVTLIGDAAHAMPPFRGQGANQAMEDAVSLGNQLSRQLNRAALESYEKEMVPRTTQEVEASIAAFHVLNRPAARL